MYFDPQNCMPPSSHAPQFTGNYGDKMIPFIGGGSLTIGPSQSSRGLEPPYQVYEGLQENPMPTMIEGYHIPTVHYDNPWQQLPDTAYPLPTSYYGGPIHGGHHPMIAAGDLSQYMEGIPLAAVPPFYGNMYRHGVHAHHHPYTPMPTIAPPLLVPALQNTPLVPTATAGDAIQSGIRNEAEGLPDIHHQPSEAQALPINNLTSENDIDEEYLLAGAPSPDTVQLSAGGHGTAPQAIVIQNAPGSRRSATETATKERRRRKANTPSHWACFHLACRKNGEPLYFGRPADLVRHYKHAKVHVPPSYKCHHEGCTATTTRKEALRKHIATRHAPKSMLPK